MIYFCIPAHDEAATIGLVLWKIRRVLEESAREYQLLVGDDASTDATAEVLEPYAKVLPLTVFRSPDAAGATPPRSRSCSRRRSGDPIGTSVMSRFSSPRTLRPTRPRCRSFSSASTAAPM